MMAGPEGNTAARPRARPGRALALWALAAGAAACAPDQTSFFIQQIQVPIGTGTSTECTVTPDPTALMRNEGTVDLLFRSNYILHPLYRSELVSYRAPPADRPEVRGLF